LATKFIRIGSAVNVHGYDDGDYAESIEVDNPIKVNATPTISSHVMRLGDIIASSKYTYNAIIVDTTLTNTHEFVEVTASGKNITLPTAVGISGKSFLINNSSTGLTTILTTNSQTINGETSQILYPDDTIWVISNGANWRII
jgi:hypothetical protein